MAKLFSYPGSKMRLARLYAPHYPPHRVFVSLFGGTGAEIVTKEPSWMEVFNDRDDFVTAVFQAIQSEQDYPRLLHFVRNTPASRSLVARCKQQLRHPEHLTTLEKAYAFLVCANFQYGACVLHSTFSTARTNTRRFRSLLRTMATFRNRFREVTIENRDWRFVLNHYDAHDTFYFADPPYHPGRLRNHPRQYYRHWFSAEDHLALLDAIQKVTGTVLLCGYDHPSYNEQLFHWRHLQFRTRMAMAKGNGERDRTEHIWLNYEADGTRVLDHKLLIAKRYLESVGNDAVRYLDLVQRTKRLAKTASEHSPELNRERATANGKMASCLRIANKYLSLVGDDDAHRLVALVERTRRAI